MEVIRFELEIDGERNKWRIEGSNTLDAIQKAIHKIPEILEFEYMKECFRMLDEPNRQKPSGVVYDIIRKKQK